MAIHMRPENLMIYPSSQNEATTLFRRVIIRLDLLNNVRSLLGMSYWMWLGWSIP